MPLGLVLPANTLSSGYEVANSCRFDGTSAYLHKSTSSGTNTKFTFSAWIKRSSSGSNYPRILGSYTDGSNYLRLNWNRATDGEQLHLYSEASTAAQLLTNRSFRDPSAWMHIVVAVDTTDGTADDRMKMYINGVQETSFATRANPGQNDNFKINNGSSTLTIGKKEGADSDYFDGYMAEVHYIDGTAYAASDFGEFDEDSPRIWKPKKVSGITYGTNGFYLDFEDSSNLGNDANGGTDLTEVNLAAADQATDTPTNNFATWNPLAYTGKTAMEEGNLKGYGDNNDSHNDGGIATIGVSTGKWYWENKITAVGGSVAVGIFPNTVTVRDGVDMFAATNSIYYKSNGKKQVSDSASNYGDSYTTNDIIGVALNLDDNEIKFYKNGTVQNSGTAISVTSISDFYFPVHAGYTNSHVTANFGNPPYANSSDAADENGYGAFEYAPPSGYLALCTKNLGSDGG